MEASPELIGNLYRPCISLPPNQGFSFFMEYRKLPDTYRKNGYTFNLLTREGLIATYSQHVEDGTIVGYESFIIQQLAATELFLNAIEAREAIPSTENWGSLAFTARTEEQAISHRKQLAAHLESQKLLQHG